jgi:uncharacterized protein (DUF849 family)
MPGRREGVEPGVARPAIMMSAPARRANVRRTSEDSAVAARKDRAVVIEAAVNGETRPKKNPHVPRTPEAISRDALICLPAGAALIHAHNDDIRLWGREAADRYEELVREAVALCAEVGRPVASCSEAAAILGLP